MNIHSELAAQAASSLAKQNDDSIRELLDRYAPGWTLEEMRGRLTLQTYAKRPGYETILLDGRPIMEMGPPESSEVFDKDTQSWKLTISRPVWR